MQHTSPFFPTLDSSERKGSLTIRTTPMPRNDEEEDSTAFQQQQHPQEQQHANMGIGMGMDLDLDMDMVKTTGIHTHTNTNTNFRTYQVPLAPQDGSKQSQSQYDREREFYMSEPSISEDGDGTSSSIYTPISPLNGGNIHMAHSPSNTSLSSMGSPGVSILRKRMESGSQQVHSDHLTPTGTLVSQFANGSGSGSGSGGTNTISRTNGNAMASGNGNGNGNTKKGGTVHVKRDGIRIRSGNIGMQETKAKDLCLDLDPIPPNKSSKEKASVPAVDPKRNSSTSNPKSSYVNLDAPGDTVADVDVDDNPTPESQRYYSANESSDDDEEGDETGSDISYGSSSVEAEMDQAEAKPREPEKNYHFLNKPLSPQNQNLTGASSECKSIDTDLLLSNTDSGPMDTSSIGGGSPEENHIQRRSFMITTPPISTPFQYSEEDDGQNVTPKRKTSNTSLADVSPSNSNGAVEPEAESQRQARPSSERRSSTGHRRTRSGDAAAATLLTGSAGWIGMEQDQLPLPNQRGADDDQEQSGENPKDSNSNPILSPNRKTQPRKKSARQKPNGSSPKVPSYLGNFDHAAMLDDNISTRFSPRITHLSGRDVDNQIAHLKNNYERKLSSGDVSEGTTETNFSWISNRGVSGTSSKGADSQIEFEASASTADSHFSWISKGGTTDSKGMLSQSDFAQFDASDAFHTTNTPNTNNLQADHNDIEMQNDQTGDSYSPHGLGLGKGQIYTATATATATPVASTTETARSKNHPVFRCPKCNTEQRQFFTVSSAPKGFESPTSYLVTYFIIYMIVSLFIFGMQEGWPALDCIYFAVTTLTSAGFGDYVPINDSAKIVNSIFIYFAMACFGLLLGSLHASSLDEAAKKQAKENMINNCIVCARERNKVKEVIISSGTNNGNKLRKRSNIYNANETSPLLKGNSMPASGQYTMDETVHTTNTGILASTQIPMAPIDLMGRQPPVRHNVQEPAVPSMNNIFDPGYTAANRKRNNGSGEKILHSDNDTVSDIDIDDQNSQVSTWSGNTNPTEDSSSDFFNPVTPIKAAKYVILTLKQAGANSLFVIVVGSFGFYYIESLTPVDSFYFTMVLFTTVGYGDIVPKTPEGKLFASVYGLIALAVLLHNVSKISMIPLELRKRRIERAVLMQFGDELDDAALKELATGPLVKRLQISESNAEGMGQCTREMFALAMLVRLGRITEQDVRSTFAAFNRLDRDNDGLLTSKEIIMNAVERKRKDQITSPSLLPEPRYKEGARMMPLAENSPLKPGHISNIPNYVNNGVSIPKPLRERGSSFESGSAYSALTYEDAEDSSFNNTSSWVKPNFSA